MSDKEAKTFAFPLRNGNYKATGNWYTFLVVDGDKALLKEPSSAQMLGKIKVGDFWKPVKPSVDRGFPLCVVTNLLWVNQSKPKEGKHHPNKIHHLRMFVITQGGQARTTEDGH